MSSKIILFFKIGSYSKPPIILASAPISDIIVTLAITPVSEKLATTYSYFACNVAVNSASVETAKPREARPKFASILVKTAPNNVMSIATPNKTLKKFFQMFLIFLLYLGLINMSMKISNSLRMTSFTYHLMITTTRLRRL